MPYTYTNYKTKRALKAAVVAGERVECYQPGPFGPGTIEAGSVWLEGPHYPQPHRWYASAVVEDGRIIRVK